MYHSPVRAPATAIPGELRVSPLQLAAALTLLALALRLTGLGSRPLWLDEAFSAWFSHRSFDYLWSVVPTFEAHPPFYYSVLKLWRSVLGESHFAMRGLSVTLGVLSVPVIVAASLEHERQCPTGRPLIRAGMAGFLAACSPLLVAFGQEARPYPLLILAYALAILALLRLSGQFRSGEPGTWGSWLLLGVGTELTLWAHGLGLLYGACIGLALLPAWLTAAPSRERFIRGAATATVAALLYVPCLTMMASRAHDWGTNWLEWRPDMLLQLLLLYTVPLQALTVAGAVAAIALLVLIKRALVGTYRSEGWNADRAILLLWLGPPMLAALVSAITMPVFLSRTLSGTLVPAFLAIGSAIARTTSARERRILAAAICITLLPTTLALNFRPAGERWDLLSSFLSQKVAPKDQVWLYPSDSALPLAAVGRPIRGTVRSIPEPFPTLGAHGPIRAGWPAVVSVTPEQAARLASDPALADVPVIWLVTRQSDIFDPAGDMPAALARIRRPGASVHWGYIEVRPYTLR